jgi:hypothetical protein
VAVIAVTSVAANLSTILAGLAVFGDRIGNDPLVVGVRGGAFALILVGAALIPAPVRAGEALKESAEELESPTMAGVAAGESIDGNENEEAGHGTADWGHRPGLRG